MSFIIDLFIPLKYEFWHFTKALELMPFLELGRQYNKIEKLYFPFELICIIVYVVVIGSLLTLGIVTPYVTGTSNPSPKMVPVFMVASVTGSVAIYKLAKVINSNRVLEYVGRNTLVFYLTHMTFLWIACELLHKYMDLNGLSVLSTCGLLLGLFIGACLWSTAFSYLLNTKYLKWILGKF
jgi:fucose 4-O-acetylase-like acetyltransferase